MSKHQKRLSVPKSWPVERKTATFTVKASGGPHGEDGVPLVVVLRDVLGFVDTTREARYATRSGGVLVNGETVSDVGRPIGMFDILSFPDNAVNYRVFPDEGGRLGLTEIDDDAAESRLGKITNAQAVDGDTEQLTLHDGTTLQADAGEYKPDDSIVIENESQEIVAHFEYEEGALVTAVDGSHAGDIGQIDSIEVTPGSSPNNAVVDDGEDGFETIEPYVVVIDENFTEDDEEAQAEAEEADAVADESEAEDVESEADESENADGGADE